MFARASRGTRDHIHVGDVDDGAVPLTLLMTFRTPAVAVWRCRDSCSSLLSLVTSAFPLALHGGRKEGENPGGLAAWLFVQMKMEASAPA